MKRSRLFCYGVGLLVGAFTAGPAGCSQHGPLFGHQTRPRSATPAPDVDLTRAYVALDRISPPIAPPRKPDELHPLSERAAQRIATAQRLVGEHRYTEAALELERALRYDPNHPEIHRTLALLHWEAGNVERARTHAGRALEIHPDIASAHYISGRCHSLEGNISAALTAYRTAMVCSDFARDIDLEMLCQYHLAGALEKEGYLEAALATYEAFEKRAASRSRPSVQEELVALPQSTHGSMGEARSAILERLGRFGEAADALAPLARVSTGDRSLGMRHARLLLRAGRSDEAVDAVGAIPSNDKAVIDLLFEIHRAAGKPGRIVEELRERLRDQPNDPTLVLALADMLDRLERSGEAQVELSRYLAAHGDAMHVRERLIEVLIARAQWVEALDVSARGIERHPKRLAQFEKPILALALEADAGQQLLEDYDGPSDNYAINYLRGALAASAGQLNRAKTLLQASLAARATFTPARVALAQAYLRSHDYDRAIRIAARADEDLPETGPLERILGQVYERLDDLIRADRHLKAAIQLNRSDIEAMFALARLYRQSGRRLQAQRQLRVLLEAAPRHEAGREMLALTYINEGKVDLGVQELRKLRDYSTHATTIARCNAMLEQISSRNPEAYRRTLLEAMDRNKSDAATWIAVADSYTEFVDAADARDAYLHALEQEPDNERATVGLIRTERQLLDLESAAQRLVSLLRRRPNRNAWRYTLIDLHGSMLNHDAALALAEEQADRDDIDDATRTRYRLRIVDSLRAAKRNEEALERLQAWVSGEKGDNQWSIRLAAAYLLEDDAAKALPIYESNYRRDATDKRALQRLVEALVRAEQFERASQFALDWIYEDPENTEATATLLYVLSNAEQLDDAIELVRNRLLDTLNREFFQNMMIEQLLRAGRHEACIEWLESLLDEVAALAHPVDGQRPMGDDALTDEQILRRPDEPITAEKLHGRQTRLHVYLAAAHMAAREYRDAETLLASWLDEASDPGERFIYLRRLATCHQALGNDTQATNTLERALILRPNHVTINNDLAYGLIDRGVRLDEADRMIRYALWRSPHTGPYLDTYGWLQYKMGAFRAAKKWLDRANQTETAGDAVVLDHLGDTSWRLGEREAAMEYWAGAVEAVGKLEPDVLTSTDIRRVRDATQQKIDAARARKSPGVAALAMPAPEDPARNVPRRAPG